ncbi:MAG: hypothetical protein ACOY82_06705 [Pseudomonadota bacterium]
MHSSPARNVLVVALLSCAAALPACGKPQPPDHEKRPGPQAAAAPPSALRETMQRPVDKAKAAEDATAAAQQQRDDALNAATGE